MEAETEEVYRINTWFAKLKNVPRNILVYFFGKKIRHQVLQQHFTTRFKINNVDVILLKEIPIDILHKQKSIIFLIDKLKNTILMGQI